ncbi:hypothetical protein DUI87_03366 [Hirundo rustica rustica]|uniref:RNase H type-1 domain-containing protein n=1 Tax=Hirundo rustica rustica TaxID=333673 RepID=A0A3M0L432_HIRRU|nr:hypothetical protein DUI87_03366 [Hirundo rustica rustica]
MGPVRSRTPLGVHPEFSGKKAPAVLLTTQGKTRTCWNYGQKKAESPELMPRDGRNSQEIFGAMTKQHSPDWADLQQILDALTETEKLLVLKVAGDLAEDDCRTTQEDVKDVFPLQDPDLKDAFFCLPLHEASQNFFEFEWESPKTGRKTQLTWCVLPQEYKNSPIIFRRQLAKDLESWEPPPGEGQLLQREQRSSVDKRSNSSLRPTKESPYVSSSPRISRSSFLSGSIGEPVIHDCLETIEATYSSRPDLKDTLLEDAETWFTDGSSYVISGRRHAGAIWKERGLLNSQGKSIKHAQEILRLLDAIQLPERVAIMHIKAHQKVSSELEEGNMLADREAKDAAKGEVPDKAVEAALIPDGKISIEGDMLLVEEADYNLLGRDLMVALGISLIVRDSRIMVGIYKLTREDEKEINPEVCHTGREAGRLDMDPISIEIERPEDPIRVKQTQPHSGSGLSPFEMLYGMPYEHGMPVGHPRVEDGQIQSYLVSINKNLQELQRCGLVSQSTPLEFAIHKIQPGDKVLVKTWKETPLTPHWEGPFLVLLTTDTAVQTSEKGWTHSSGVKRIESGDNPLQWKVTSAPGDLKLKIHGQTG